MAAFNGVTGRKGWQRECEQRHCDRWYCQCEALASSTAKESTCIHFLSTIFFEHRICRSRSLTCEFYICSNDLFTILLGCKHSEGDWEAIDRKWALYTCKSGTMCSVLCVSNQTLSQVVGHKPWFGPVLALKFGAREICNNNKNKCFSRHRQSYFGAGTYLSNPSCKCLSKFYLLIYFVTRLKVTLLIPLSLSLPPVGKGCQFPVLIELHERRILLPIAIRLKE